MPNIVSRLFRYWREYITNTKDVWTMITWILAIISWLVVAAIEITGISLPSNWTDLTKTILEKGLWGVAILLTLRAVLWLPFRRHEVEQAKFVAEKTEMEIAHNEEKRRLRAEIKKLSDEEAKAIAAERVKNGKKRLLANLLSQLDAQILKVNDISFYSYDGDTKKKACQDTDVLIEKIADILDTVLDDPFAAARFRGVRASHISFGANVPDIHAEMHREWLSLLSYLENHKQNLVECGKTT